MVFAKSSLRQVNKVARAAIAGLLAFSLTFAVVIEGATTAFASETSATLSSASTTSELLFNGYPVYQGSVQVEVGYASAPNKESAFYYSDGYFAQDPSITNEHLATFSMIAASTAMTTASTNVRNFFNYFGATNVATRDFDATPTTDTIGVAVATKTLFAGTSDECSLICVLARGGGYDSEWANNFLIGVTGDHEGLTSAATKTVAFVNKYITDNSIDTSKAKLWITGYSRAGAVANLAGKTFSDSAAFGKSKVYAYCMEPPMATNASEVTAKSYSNIHVYCNKNDVVTYVAPSYMGFRHYGTVHEFGDCSASNFATQEAAMLKHFALLNKNSSKYVSPTSLTWKRIDTTVSIDNIRNLIAGKIFSNPKNTYSSNPSVLYNLILTRMKAQAAKTRDAFCNSIPDDVQTAASYMNVTSLSFEDALGRLLTLYFTTSSSVQDKLINNFEEFPGEYAAECLQLLDYLDDMKLWTISSYKALVKKLWDCLEKGGGDFKSLSECGLTTAQINELKAILPSALYYIACYTKQDLRQDQQTLGTLAYESNLDVIVEAHCVETNLAWLRSFDSYYATDTTAAFSQSATQYETYIYAASGSSLEGTTITVKKSNGSTIATIVDGAVGNSSKTSFNSSCVKLRGTGNEVSIVTLASAGTCTVTVQAEGKEESSPAVVQMKRRNVNVLAEGSIVDSADKSVMGKDYALYKGVYISASVAAAKTTVSYIGGLDSYDMSGVSFDNATYVYDGTSRSIAIKGTLPDGVSVEYQGNGVSEGGVHTVTAIFTGDTTTHRPIPSMLATITITPADNAISNLTIEGWTYGRAANSPSANASYGASTIKYLYSDSKTGVYSADVPVAGGTWWVKAAVKETASWKAAESAPVSFVIAQAENTISNLAITGWTYGQDANSPSANATYGEGVIEYTYSDAEDGTYTADVPTTAGTWWVKASVAETDSWKAAENKTSFVILQAANAISNLAITGWTYGQDANSPSANATYGEDTITYAYSNAAAGTYTADVPTTAGTWYVKASIAETDNWAAAVSDPVSFTIAKASGNAITNLAITGWTYGQKANAPSANATYGESTIEYSYASSKTGTYTADVPTNAGTWWVKASVAETVSWPAAVSEPISFTIAKADYNMAGVGFNSKTVTFNGSPQSILISGSLPEGVSVTYDGNGQTAVGTYTVTAHFTGDANHNTIADKQATLVIKSNVTPNKATFDLSGISNPGTTIYIDGVAKTMQVSGNTGTVVLDNANATVATLYVYNKTNFNTADKDEMHSVYPTHMYVWTLSGSAGKEYSVTRQAGLDDILQYAGTAIRLTGNKGIRLVTAVPTDKKNALTSASGYQGFQLEEYGTLIQFDSTLKGADVLTTNTQFKNYAYSRANGKDPIYVQANGLTKYTNVLIGFTNEQCSEELSLRSYMKLKNLSTGQTITIYGGATHRSIGYVAYQNKDKFDKSSDAGQFIWGIIHAVYGNKYD